VISALLEEGLFASDLDPLDMQLIDQFLRPPGSSSVASRDVEQHDSFPRGFSPIFGSSVPTDPNPDFMSLNVAQCSDIFVPKATTPDLVLSGPGSSAPTFYGAEGYQYRLSSESRVERSASTGLALASHDRGFSLSQDISSFKSVTDSPSLISADTHLQGSLRVVEGVNLPMPLSSAQFASGTVNGWDSCIHDSVDFVAMEF